MENSIYHDCAGILGQHAQDVLTRMSSIAPALGALTYETGSLNRQYAEAVKVSFRGQAGEAATKGYLIWAFHVFKVAQELGRDIAVKMGLEAELAGTREGVENILGETLNIIIGLTSSDWSQKGLDIVFDPPEKLGAHLIDAIPPDQKAFHVTLTLEKGPDISIFLHFTQSSS
ncbi:MAG: hypothetical protein LBS60_05810 [Deltaproteobacteria bacterium]|jgi:hypothetical protein|nr:hypothetical protein [Deltaproteobacteria bacterium]